MYSQYGEDAFILEHFGDRVGSFIDVGAYDGLTFSNTRCLMERGWSGVCIEPNPLVFPYLMENTKQFPKVELLNAGIDVVSAVDEFWVCQDCYSTQLEEFSKKISRHNKKIQFRRIYVNFLAWSDLPGFLCGEIDFINIDVEGMNREVLAQMDLRPKMLCVELDPPDHAHDIRQLVKDFGYRNTKEIGGNLLAWL